MQLFRFTADLHCYLEGGATQIIRNRTFNVQASTRAQARKDLVSVATEWAQDEGGNLTDAPMDYLTVHNVKAI